MRHAVPRGDPCWGSDWPAVSHAHPDGHMHRSWVFFFGPCGFFLVLPLRLQTTRPCILAGLKIRSLVVSEQGFNAVSWSAGSSTSGGCRSPLVLFHQPDRCCYRLTHHDDLHNTVGLARVRYAANPLRPGMRGMFTARMLCCQLPRAGSDPDCRGTGFWHSRRTALV